MAYYRPISGAKNEDVFKIIIGLKCIFEIACSLRLLLMRCQDSI